MVFVCRFRRLEIVNYKLKNENFKLKEGYFNLLIFKEWSVKKRFRVRFMRSEKSFYMGWRRILYESFYFIWERRVNFF